MWRQWATAVGSWKWLGRLRLCQSMVSSVSFSTTRHPPWAPSQSGRWAYRTASKVWNEWYFYNDMILDDCQNSTTVSFLQNTQNKICQMKYFFKWYRMLWYNLSLCVSYEIKLQSSDWKILLEIGQTLSFVFSSQNLLKIPKKMKKSFSVFS